jgi:hypothetical protein
VHLASVFFSLDVSGFMKQTKGSLEVSGFFTGGQWFFHLCPILGSKTVSLEVSGFFTGGKWLFVVIFDAPTDEKCTSQQCFTTIAELFKWTSYKVNFCGTILSITKCTVRRSP